MTAGRDNTTALDEARLPVRARLVAAWTGVMFLYAYVDIIGFFVPGKIEDILAGIVFEFDITQVRSRVSRCFAQVRLKEEESDFLSGRARWSRPLQLSDVGDAGLDLNSLGV